jgi:hypothetical protein
MVAGSILGGGVLILLGASREVYFILFAGSSLLRLGALYFLPRIPARLLERQTAIPSRVRPVLPALLPTSVTNVIDSASISPGTVGSAVGESSVPIPARKVRQVAERDLVRQSA